jgi:hypothetical protein
MQAVFDWFRRRPTTIALIAFFLAWYGLELAVFNIVGEGVARYWFYIEQPPRHISPGLLFAPVSHNLYRLTHIGANVGLLLLAGGVAEPYIGWRRVLLLVIGLGFIGTYAANLSITVHRMWIMAGASGGILSLWAYSGIHLAGRAWKRSADGLAFSWHGVKTIGMLALSIGTPVFLYHQAIWIPRLHSGHVIGLLLGWLYYMVETGFNTVVNGKWRSVTTSR